MSNWEFVNHNTARLRVFGGWMVAMKGVYDSSITSIFVPDIYNEWKLDNEKIPPSPTTGPCSTQ